MTLSPLRSTLSRLSSPLNRQTATTDSSIMPYAIQAAKNDIASQNKAQPLKMILDLLQRGQYLTANIADEIEESFRTGRPLGPSTVEVLKAAFQGLTGKRKGDWETLLFGGNIEGVSDQGGARPGWLPEKFKETAGEPLIRWGPEGSSGVAEGILRPRKLIGLAANIALDPTTYVGFGATSFARASAKKFAEDAVKLKLATMGAEDLARLGVKFEEKVKGNLGNVVDAITKGENAGAKKMLAETYNKAYQTALRHPAVKAMESLQPEFEQIMKRPELMNQPGMEGLLSTMTQQSYAGAGQRAFRFAGKEVGASIREPWAPTRAWDLLKSKFETSKPGEKLGDAWWSVMNTGPVGAIRKALGIRNPYEQMVNLQRKTIEHGAEAQSHIELAKMSKVVSQFDEETLKNAVEVRWRAEQWANSIEKAMPNIGFKPTDLPDVDSLLNNLPFFEAQYPGLTKQLGIKPENVEQIKTLWHTIDEVGRKWTDEYAAKAQSLGMPVDDFFRVNYFPRHQGTGPASGVKGGGGAGTSAGGFAKEKQMITEQDIQSSVSLWKWLLKDKLPKAWEESGKAVSYDEFVRQFVIDKNLADSTLDLAEAFKLRAIDQAKAMGRLNMIENFRQFGIPVDEAAQAVPELAGKLATWGTGVSPIGLYKISDKIPGFQSYLFDGSVADAITKASVGMAGDEVTKQFLKHFGSFTTWWKGFVTLTPGFHIRNWLSNNVTGFLKFGPRWFAQETNFAPVAAGVAYALHPENYVDLLKEGMPEITEGWVSKQLNTRIGDFTVKELADYARSTGLVSARTQVGEEVGKGAMSTWNPLSTKFKAFGASRTVGDFIENTAKFQSFLMDYQDMLAKAGQAGGDVAERLASSKAVLEYADQESKKWFLDYSDLTDFEKNVMKKVIPFYAWLRKNVANQLTGLTMYPEMYSVIPKVRGAMTSDEGFDYSLEPDYMKNLQMYPIGKTAGGSTIMRWANIPLEDLNKIPLMFEEGNLFKPRFKFQEIVDDVMAAAHPLLKSFIEMATGRNVWQKRDIKPLERAVPIMQYLSNAPKVVGFLDGIMRLAGFEDGLKINVSSDGKEVQINGKVERLLETNFPVLKGLDMIVNAPETVAERVLPGLESAIERISGKHDYYKGLEEVFQVISQIGGTKFKELNLEDQRKWKEEQLMREAEKLRASERSNTVASQIRKKKALQARESRNRRVFGRVP